jgi:hypothetical protein
MVLSVAYKPVSDTAGNVSLARTATKTKAQSSGLNPDRGIHVKFGRVEYKI